MPTGSGKTIVLLSLLDRIKPPRKNPNAVQSLVLVNKVEIAQQTAIHARKLFPHWTVEIEQGAAHQASGDADLYVWHDACNQPLGPDCQPIRIRYRTIATYQTLSRPQHLHKFDANKFKAVIVDEAHHAAAPS